MGFIKLKDWEAYVYVKDELKAPDEEAFDAAGGSSGVGEANPEEVEELPRDERLEPIVYLDPKIKPTVIVKHYREQYSNVVPGPNGEEEQQNSTGQIDDENDNNSTEGAIRNTTEETDVTKTNGMFVPLVMVAGIVVDDSNVMYMELRSSGILPEIELLIQDEKELFRTLTTPGVSSKITVSILPTKDGAYKKISLDFVIDSYEEEYDDNDILCLRYFGTYKLNELRVHKNMSVHYIDIPSISHNLGSHNIFVQPEPTTWEILYHISTNTGLGLATNPDIERLNDGDTDFVIGIGNNAIRKSVAEKYDVNWVAIVHPSAQIAFNAAIGKGTVVMACAVANASSVIGEHCIINTGAIVEHDNVIENYTHISPGAKLGGTVHIGE